MPEGGIGPVGSVASRTGSTIDVLYDGMNKFVGLSDGNGQVFIFNVNEAEQIMALMREAVNLTQKMDKDPGQNPGPRPQDARNSIGP